MGSDYRHQRTMLNVKYYETCWQGCCASGSISERHWVTVSFLLTLFPDFSQSLSDTCEIRVFQIVCESCDICYYTFQRVVFGDLFAGLENEFNITGLESIGFIISITLAVTDTKLSFKHPNDTLKFNEILSPANI